MDTTGGKIVRAYGWMKAIITQGDLIEHGSAGEQRSFPKTKRAGLQNGAAQVLERVLPD